MAPDPLPMAAPGKTSVLGDQHHSGRKQAPPAVDGHSPGVGQGEWGRRTPGPAGPHLPPGAALHRGCRRESRAGGPAGGLPAGVVPTPPPTLRK